MKRGKKLISLLAVLVLLIGAAVAATMLNPENQAAQEEEDTSVSVFSAEAESVTALSWSYEGEQLNFVCSDGVWTYADDGAFPLDTSYIDYMLSSISDVVASKTIDTPEELAEYGLEEPVCTIDVTTEEGTTRLRVGSETAMDGLLYFSQGDGKVYLVDSGILTPFTYSLYTMLAYEQIPSMSVVESMTIDSDIQQLQIVCMENSGLAYSDSYVWFLKDGEGWRTLDSELTDSFLGNVTDLILGSCVNYNADDAALAEYGLDTPVAVVTVDYLETVQVETGETDEEGNAVYETQSEQKQFVLELGGVADYGRYIRMADSRMVYTLDSTTCDALLYTTYAELQPDEVLLMDWDTVDTVTITLDGVSYEAVRGTKEETDEEGNTTTETVYTLNGTEEEDLITVIETLPDMPSTGYAGGTVPERGAEISFLLKRNTEGFQQIELTFYQYDSTSCLVMLNGVSTVFVDRDNVVALVEAVNAVVLE